MFDYNKAFSNSINQLKQEERYRIFATLCRDSKTFPRAKYYYNETDSKEVILWCSNDYMGQGCNTEVIEAMCNAAKNSGTGAGGTRNISGNTYYHKILEKKLASYHQKKAALLFTSGYVANEAAISSLVNALPGCVIFSDEKNHASIIAGIKSSKAPKHIFKHNDMSDLENLLKLYSFSTPKLIIFESVYSMDGSIGNIEAISNLAKKYGALTYIDEVHAVGMYGKTGAGMVEHLNCVGKIDIIQATLGKAIGSIGGYVAANDLIIDVIRSNASGFIFTTSIPPSVAAASFASINYLASEKGCELREKHQANAKYLKNLLKSYNLPILDTDTHIIPLIVGDAYYCRKLCTELLERFSIYIQPINYPTVPKGTERLRITPTPFHTQTMMDNLTAAIDTIWRELNITQEGNKKSA